MKKISSKAVVGAIGATFITSLAVMPSANAAENPFAAKHMVSGYQLADAKDGNCGGKQAAPVSKEKKDGSCGGSKNEKN